MQTGVQSKVKLSDRDKLLLLIGKRANLSDLNYDTTQKKLRLHQATRLGTTPQLHRHGDSGIALQVHVDTDRAAA